MSDDWRQKAREEHQRYLSLLGDRLWDAIDPGDVTILMKKVGSGLYAPPPELPSDDNKDTGYSGDKIERIEKLRNKLIEPFKFKSE